MEKRFGDMINRNAQRRYLPRTLMDEVNENRKGKQVANLRDLGADK